MKLLYFLALLLIAVEAAVVVQNGVERDDTELPLAEPCDEEACQLPNCRCSSVNIPGGLAARDVPQFVTITFDDGVNVNNILTYREVMYNRFNLNGCPASATFFINHEYTNYQLVNELYNNGFEIALHSISHQNNLEYWRDATTEDMIREFVDQRIQVATLSNIPTSELNGVRIPFLQMTGNASFQAMAEGNLLYDSSWPTISFVNPGLWPYTLHYESIQDCLIPPCPTASIPGPWVIPMVSWIDNQGSFCSMVDSCYFRPATDDEEGWYRFILTNFERHYAGNRAPFGFYVHEWFISTYPAIQNAFVRFMNTINNLNDVFMVTSKEVIDWVQDPIPIDEYRAKPCRLYARTACSAVTCPLTAEHNGVEYWMTICNTCPRAYPWLGNPLGL